MTDKSIYGQFCPLAMAAEFLCKRWTVLILRELFLGSTSFNDIGRGLTRMSRTLLSKRLKELEHRGLIKKGIKSNQRETCYELTESGQSLRSIIFSMADWSQEWLHLEPALENIDADHLLWSLRRSSSHHPQLPKTFIVHIYMPDQPDQHQNGWLIFDDGEVELCIIDRDFEVDMQIEASAEVLTKVFMGWLDLTEAVATKALIFRGQQQYSAIANQWLGRSRLASIKKQPRELRVS